VRVSRSLFASGLTGRRKDTQDDERGAELGLARDVSAGNPRGGAARPNFDGGPSAATPSRPIQTPFRGKGFVSDPEGQTEALKAEFGETKAQIRADEERYESYESGEVAHL
jgi:hypothetical protein